MRRHAPLCVVLMLWALPSIGSTGAADERPNIVVILADDLGYGDLGSYGNPTIRTPNLDRMAAEGQRWTSFYAGAPVCSPSRAALLTGRLPVRIGVYRNEPADTGNSSAPGVFMPDATRGLPAAEITLAEILKARGYATAIIGKWHLGHRPEYLPQTQGFDDHWGMPYSNDMGVAEGLKMSRALMFDPRSEYWTVPILHNGEVVERPVQQETVTRRYARHAVEFIRAHDSSPFFLYLAHQMPHVPLFRSREFEGRSAAGRYGDVLEEIDWSVGEVLQALRSSHLERRTIVLFTSDNGPWRLYDHHGGSPGPLRDGKGSTWEGGVRVPAVFWGPGHVKPATVQDIGSFLDVLPTVAALTGAAPPTDRVLDGLDLSPALRGTGPSPRDTIPYWRDAELYAFRKGPWKAHFITRGAYGRGAPREPHDAPELYHLGIDPGERVDVAAEHPDVVRELTTLAEAHRRAMVMAPPLLGK